MIQNFTDRFLSYSRVTLFLLFLMMGVKWYSSSNPTPGYIASVVNLVGIFSLLAWIYAIGHRANERLQKRKIEVGVFKLFDLGFLVVIGSMLIMFVLSQGDATYGDDSGNLTYHVTYTRPGEIAFLFLAGLIFTTLVAAKVLVSAEKNKDAEFADYFTTFLMLAFPWIGLWWIQPRARNL